MSTSPGYGTTPRDDVFVDPRLSRAHEKAYRKKLPTDPANPENKLGRCSTCDAPTSKKCSRCKAFSICSKDCFTKAWKAHKADCNELFAARETAEKAEFPTSSYFKGSMAGIPTAMDGATFLSVNERMKNVYAKYKVEEPPTMTNKTLSDERTAEFFADVLEAHDSGSQANKEEPLSVRLFLNRRYNNIFMHAMNNFNNSRSRVYNRLLKLMEDRHIGDHFR
jgi:hypothetical protein